MINKTAVRSTLVLLAMSGMLAACGSNSGSNGSHAPAAKSADGSTILSQEVTQKASVKIASITDAEGNSVALESSSVLSQLSAVDRAVVTKEAVQLDGAIVERTVIDLNDMNGPIVKFHGDAALTELTVATGGFPASAAEAVVVDGKIAQLLVRVEDGRAMNVVLAFGDEPKQDEPKQDEPKQDEPKQDEPKQDEPKQDEPKQDEPKQDEPKQDEPKQDEPKQDEPKQDEPKQDEPKQDEPKQDEPKQDEPKQDEPKQDEPKQDEPKQDEPKQDEPKQDEPKQDEPKQRK